MTGSNKLTKADYTKTTLRAYFLQNGFNYTNYQGLGYALVMYPAFKKLYGDDKERFAKELENNSEFYNTNPNFLPFITSIHLAMAESRRRKNEVLDAKMEEIIRNEVNNHHNFAECKEVWSRLSNYIGEEVYSENELEFIYLHLLNLLEGDKDVS
mgnify:CR=1 FL=1